MALAIQSTPVLKGKDAKRFRELAEENRNKSMSIEKFEKEIAFLFDKIYHKQDYKE
jgi:hypothetical protein